MIKRDELIALADLRRANVTRQKEWDAFDQLTLAYRGNELAGEVGEACNVIKKLERERLGIKGSRDTVEHLAEELADVIICTDLIAMQAGIDLSSAVIAKFNASSEKVGLKTRLYTAPSAVAPGPSEPSSTRSEVTALADIATERQRQREVEGWTPAHDDGHDTGEMAGAAACYALSTIKHWAKDQVIKLIWPWADEWWKPKDARRNLVKAGALIVAEIERLDRLDQFEIRRK
jgi:NTP pyrophosphatase (non-canonical NTP hydrolase)